MRYHIKKDPRIKAKETQFNLPICVDFTGEFTEEKATMFRQNMNKAEAYAIANGYDIIPINIDSYGGDAYAFMSCVDVINALDKRIRVATIVTGKAMSAGAYLFTCGHPGLRFMSENATLMFHNILASAEGSIGDMQISIDEAKRLNEKIMGITGKNLKRKDSFLKALLKDKENRDLFLDAEKAKKFGIVDHVGIPQFNIELSLKVDFVFDKKKTEKVENRIKKKEDKLLKTKVVEEVEEDEEIEMELEIEDMTETEIVPPKSNVIIEKHDDKASRKKKN